MKRITINYNVQDSDGNPTPPTVIECEDRAAGYRVQTDEKGSFPVGYLVFAGHDTVLVPFAVVLNIKIELDAKVDSPLG